MTKISKPEWEDSEENTIVWYRNGWMNIMLLFYDNEGYVHILKKYRSVHPDRDDIYFRLTDDDVRDMILPRII